MQLPNDHEEARRGLHEQVIDAIVRHKHEPDWMRALRVSAYQQFVKMPLPSWGVDLSALSFEELTYYNAPFDRPFASWQEVPHEVKETFVALGIPEHEHPLLAGVGTQYESEMLFKQLADRWREQGVIFCSMDDAVQHYPDLVKQYFGSVISADDNKFSALNGAVWSGGSFVYVPAGVKVELPVHAYFRMQAERMGQFERTLIIAEEGSSVHYLEGCSAPLYTTRSLHSAVVEIIAKKNAHVRYTTIQNWSRNVYNLVTKRAHAYENAVVEWIDGNFGSAATMKYPCIVLQGKGARGLVVSLAVAGEGQEQDSGAKFIHKAPQTHSQCIAKSVVQGTGKSVYRGLVVVTPEALESQSFTQCDALVLDERAQIAAEPCLRVANDQCNVGHEATVSALDDEQLFYGESRGISRQTIRTLVVHGFADLFVNELPLEYAVELTRLLQLTMKE
jgi:Fe-S cluster assembly protein SufB